MNRQTALLVIDVQMAFLADRAAGYAWGNAAADQRVADLLAGFRRAGLPVIHVHHHDLDPASDFHSLAPGAQVQPCALPLPGEPVIVKHGSSAFIGTRLEQRLHAQGLTGLVIAGGAANFCVESTARMAADLGLATTVVGDALINFQRSLHDGRVFPPEDVLAMTLANLAGDFARIVGTDQVLAELPA